MHALLEKSIRHSELIQISYKSIGYHNIPLYESADSFIVSFYSCILLQCRACGGKQQAVETQQYIKLPIKADSMNESVLPDISIVKTMDRLHPL
jgi:hypothetical protein